MSNTTFEILPLLFPNVNDSEHNDFPIAINSSESFSENINLSSWIPLTYTSFGNEFPLISSEPSIHSLDKESDEDKKRFFFDNSSSNLSNINEEKDNSDNIVNQPLRKKRGRPKKNI